MKELKASKIIKQSCCGHFLDVPVSELVRKVTIIECENIILKNNLENALVEIKRLKNER